MVVKTADYLVERTAPHSRKDSLMAAKKADLMDSRTGWKTADYWAEMKVRS